MLKMVEAQEGPLPEDFNSLDYMRLNGDLQPELRHPWQAAEHYLRHGRHHGRRYKAMAAGFTDRSPVDHLRRRLIQAFGGSLTSETLVLQVHKAAGLAAASATLAAPLMDPVLIARWMLASPEGAAVDFTRLEVQLYMVFKAAFDQVVAPPRIAVEMDVINRLRREAITTTLCAAGPGRPPVTLLMLATLAASGGPVAPALSPDQATALVARFFAHDAPRLGLERYITPEQRALLRAPASPQDSRPLAARLLDEVRGLGSPERAGPPAGDAPSFFDQDVWLSDMDYLLSGAQLTAMQVQVVREGDHVDLSAPSFLFQDHLGSSDEVSWVGREAAQGWLHRFVWRERNDWGLPQTIVGPSASAYACGAVTRRAGEAHGTDPGEGRKRLRTGEQVAFGVEGAGRNHLIGPSWHSAEAAQTWSAANTALLAFNLDEEDLGPLDLFVRLSLGPRRDPQVSAWWNGVHVGVLRPPWSMPFTLHCHLGAHHRGGGTPNILCLSVPDTIRVEGDRRPLGVALHDLMLVRR